MPSSLINFDRADRALAAASTLRDILEIRDKADAVRHYVKAQKKSLRIQNRAAAIKLKAERKAGKLLAEMRLAGGARRSKSRDVTLKKLEAMGISRMQSHRWQREAEMSDDDFEALVDRCDKNECELTQAAVLKAVGAPHLSRTTGQWEWYTPAVFAQCARAVMGRIDLDPASSATANKTIKAARWYGLEQDGLNKRWFGRVWLNPPYSRELVGKFTEKLREHVLNGDIKAAVLMVGNATDTCWFQDVVAIAATMCFVRGRVCFNSPDGPGVNRSLQGHVLLYFGPNSDSFIREFSRLGICCRPHRRPT